MRIARLILLLLFPVCMALHSRAQDSVQLQLPQAPKKEFRCGPPLAGGLILFETIAGGFSYYAARPQNAGDKVMGWYYAAASAGMLAQGTAMYFGANRDRPLPERVGESVLVLGIGYGLARLATYNLVWAGNDGEEKRFGRNMLEFHTAFFGALALELLVEASLTPFNNKGKKQVHITGAPNGVGIAISF